MKTAYLLTGKPRSGKTTAIKQIIEAIGREQCGGFYTEEIRLRETRVGFRLVTLDGQQGILAHVNEKSSLHVGRYAVNLSSLDSAGIAALSKAVATGKLLVVDEIGPMEIASELFKKAILDVLESAHLLVGTIAMHPHPWLDAIKQHERVEVWELTSSNRTAVIEQVIDTLAATLRSLSEKRPPLHRELPS
jgi:nucleoside-triphosphatase